MFQDPLKNFLQEYAEHILASLEEGTAVINRKGQVVFFNPTAEHLTGLSQSQVRLHPYTEVFQANPWVAHTIRSTLLSTASRTVSEGELWGSSSRPTPVRLITSPILDHQGSLLGVALLMHNLSYQKKLEEDLTQTDRLTRLGMVVAGLAHEIKNPLAGIRGALQLLQRQPQADPQTQSYMQAILREMDRIDALLDHLFELASPPPLEYHPVNIHKVLTEVLLLEKSTAPSHMIIQTQFDPSLPEILGNETQLAQVFRNLVKNALQALSHQDPATLSISTRMETDFHILHPHNRRRRFLSVNIEDNGPGIAPEHLPFLFTPLFTTKSEGKGLGLALSRSIVAQHGGTIHVESEPGKRTLFKVILPIALRDKP